MMAEKKEADGMHPASDYAYTPDKEKVSTWKLRIDDSTHVSSAVAALGKGLMGNKVEIPQEDLPAVKRKVRAAYRKFFPNNELPEILKSSITKAEYTRNEDGTIEYRGEKFPGFNKPKKDSGDKQGAVLVKRGDKIKVVRFGDPSLSDNGSVEANDAFYARFGGQEGMDDPFSPLYWSARWLWPRGKMKGKGPKEFFTVNKSKSLSEVLSDKITSIIVKYFGSSEKESTTEVIKASEEMVSYEVVYEPFIKDAHGQWMSDTTLQQACENFNENLKKGVVQPNLFHLENTKAFTIEDSWIQKELDVVVEATGEKIKAGTWICKLKYHDNDLWTLKKAGVVGGVSIGARGQVDHSTGEITNVTFDGDS